MSATQWMFWPDMIDLVFTLPSHFQLCIVFFSSLKTHTQNLHCSHILKKSKVCTF